MKSAPSAQQRDKALVSLREVTESLRKRNDSLESHLIETGWLGRRATTAQPPIKNETPPCPKNH